MGFVKGNDGIARTVRNPLEGSVGDINLDDISSVTLEASANITGGNILTSGQISATGVLTAGTLRALSGNIGVPAGVAALNLGNNVVGTVNIGGGAGNIFIANVNSTTRVAGNLTAGGTVSATGNITGNTAGFAIGYRDIPQVSFTGNATIATADAGKHFYSTQSTSYILTIANNASQSFQTGSAVTIINQGTGNITVAQGSGVTLYLAGNATSGNRTVSTFGMATLIKVATDTWFINGSGVA
jgi:hypothetical protein